MPAPAGAPQTHLTGEGLKGRDAREFDRLNRSGSLTKAAFPARSAPPRIRLRTATPDSGNGNRCGDKG